MKGGKKGTRDRNFGITDKDFWNWWHRSPDGKKGHGGEDISSSDEARNIYEYWLEMGKPKMK